MERWQRDPAVPVATIYWRKSQLRVSKMQVIKRKRRIRFQGFDIIRVCVSLKSGITENIYLVMKTRRQGDASK